MQSSGISIPVTLALALAALVYTRGWYRLRDARSNLVPRWRFAVFFAGLISVWIAVGSPLAELDHEMLFIHMVQHLLLMAVGAPLILLGAPIAIRTIRQGLTHPALGWLAGTAAVIGWHVPAAFELAMRSHFWHATQQATFFLAGILFWSPVIGSRTGIANKPEWFVPLYLFLGTLPCDALSAFLTFCDRVVYKSYARRPHPLDISPLQDQETAGALMWVCVTFVYLLPAVVITIRLLSAPDAGPEMSSALVSSPSSCRNSQNGFAISTGNRLKKKLRG
jgi:cytochrome c oxidase assembly factor CtaG